MCLGDAVTPNEVVLVLDVNRRQPTAEAQAKRRGQSLVYVLHDLKDTCVTHSSGREQLKRNANLETLCRPLVVPPSARASTAAGQSGSAERRKAGESSNDEENFCHFRK